MRKSWIVARHEFLVTIKRVWFVVSTFVFPLIFLGIGLAVLLLTKETVEQAQQRVTQRPLGVVDQWGGLQTEPKGFSILRYEDEKKALNALQNKKIDTYIVLQNDYLETGHVEVRTTHKPSIMTENRSLTPPGLKPWIVENILTGTENPKVTRVKNPLLLQQIEFDGLTSV